MLHDCYLTCDYCRKVFLFSIDDQILAFQRIPLDDRLDPPGKEMVRWILPPSKCERCSFRLVELE